MTDEKPCPLCNFPAHVGPMTADPGPVWPIDCPGCGRYSITTTALSILPSMGEDLFRLRGWVYDQNLLGAVPELDTKTFDSVKRHQTPSLAEKIDRLLLALVRDRPYPGKPLPVGSPRLLVATYAKDLNEVRWIGTLLEKHEWVVFHTGPAHLPDEAFPWGQEVTAAGPTAEYFLVTPDGYLKAEDLIRQVGPSSQGFVAMWFSDDMRRVYDDAIAPAIMGAGYRPLRVDRTEHINKIDDEIIAQIRRSRFVVADFTGHRGGVYFEVGYAMGREIPVIWCCRENELEGLHFDVRQFNCIDWQTPEKLRARLQVRIEAAIGDGPLKKQA